MSTDVIEERSVDRALAKFKLISGAGDGETSACVMTALSWAAGEAWSDHPSCAHRLLSTIAIKANDATGTTPEQRAEIVRAGEHGLIDTWWVPAEVIVEGLAKANDLDGAVAKALAVINHVAAWKSSSSHAKPDLRSADLRSAVLSGAVLSGAVLSGAVLSGADLSGADLRSAVLSGAVGDKWTVLPAGCKWKVADSGLLVPEGA